MSVLNKNTVQLFKTTSERLSIDLNQPLCMRDQVTLISEISGVQRQEVIDTLKALTHSVYCQLLDIKLDTVKIDGLITFERVVRKPRKAGKRRTSDGTEIKIRGQPAKFDVVTKHSTLLREKGTSFHSTCDKKLRQTVSDNLNVPNSDTQ
ncbi:HU family DNA-binding protein [Shewanella aestuarii]|uniref:HU domain-containing protein n=1 Tax=Shewanella aestuarii TaxID=1028752 RepID=A0A6G9QPH6_9GAMM|nr:HU family DNA-binding protein [Shewanella aestuarii]QIR16494.1 hypothetical protein HBH39_18635 [Shewanella aestuarii]